MCQAALSGLACESPLGAHARSTGEDAPAAPEALERGHEGGAEPRSRHSAEPEAPVAGERPGGGARGGEGGEGEAAELAERAERPKRVCVLELGEKTLGESSSGCGEASPTSVAGSIAKSTVSMTSSRSKRSSRAATLARTGSFISNSSRRALSRVINMNSAASRSSVSRESAIQSAIEMRLSSPDILRAIKAAVPLKHLGKLMWTGGGSNPTSTYEQSFRVERISEFWSHSWHSKSWQKIAVLMARYNGLPAMVAGTLAAVVGTTLTTLGVLPGLSTKTLQGETYPYGCWALLLGTLVAIIVLPLWQSRCKVFLDRACINQTDSVLKKEGVESIGAFLHQSDAMVVLWDPSYVTRLWCVFELAAYLRTHDGDNRLCLCIRPLILAPLSFAIYAVIHLIYLYYLIADETASTTSMLGVSCVAVLAITPLLHVLRKYHRSIGSMREELQRFSVCQAQCFCCSVAHKDPETNEELFCDRELVEACIVSWFGSIRAFERKVQLQLFKSIEQQLGRHAIPYHWLICAMCPVLWAHLDIVASRLRGQHYHQAAAQALSALSFWLCAYPLFFAWCVKCASVLRVKMKGSLSDTLLSVAGAAASAVPACSIWWASFVPPPVQGNQILSSFICLAVLAVLAICVWRAPCR